VPASAHHLPVLRRRTAPVLVLLLVLLPALKMDRPS
jgi:hypothetical protein